MRRIRTGELRRVRARVRRDRVAAHRSDRRRRAGRGRGRRTLAASSPTSRSDTTTSTSRAATAHGITVCNTPGVLDETTADTAFLLILAASRLGTDRRTPICASGAWKGWGITQYLGRDVHGATLGIVGYGRIGRAVARRAAGIRDARAAPRPHGRRTNRATSPTSTSCSRKPTSSRSTRPAAPRRTTSSTRAGWRS